MNYFRKRLLFTFSVFVFFAVNCAAAPSKKAPAWLTDDPHLIYSENEYLTAIGEGNSDSLARDDALNKLSQYFDTKVHSEGLAIRATNDSSFSSSSLQTVSVESEADLFCVNFTDSFFDKKNAKYFILAYINKKEAAEIYRSKIEALLSSITQNQKNARNEREVFFKALLLRKSAEFCESAEKYIQYETALIHDDVEKYKPALVDMTKIFSELDSLKPQLTFSITMNQKEKRFNPVFSTLAEALEKQGFSYSVNDSMYRIIADISCEEEVYETGPFVRPSLDVLIVNKNGEGLYTYSKAYGRTGAKTMEQAYTRSVSKITKDLAENFMTE